MLIATAKTIGEARQKQEAADKLLSIPYRMVASGVWETLDSDLVFLSPRTAQIVRIPSRACVVALVDGEELSIRPHTIRPEKTDSLISFHVDS